MLAGRCSVIGRLSILQSLIRAALQVRDLRHRQQDDLARESRRLKSIADKEAAEEEKRAQLTKQEEEHTLRLQVGFFKP